MTIYYVKNGGDDNAAGTSDATAWATVGKVNSFAFSASDQVYFKCGSTFSTSSAALTIGWDGTSSNRVVVGAYYMSGGTEVIGVSGNKPIFDGGWDGQYQSGCFELYGADIAISGDYVTLQDIRLQNCNERGISTTTDTNLVGLIIQRVDVDSTFNEALVLDWNAGDGTIIQDCTFNYISQSRRLGCNMSGHPGGVVTTNNDTITFRRNKLSKSSTEGFIFGAGGCIVEDNEVFCTHNPGIYCSPGETITTPCVIRRNLVYGSTDEEYWWTGTPPYCGDAITLTDEYYLYGVHKVDIYCNLIAFTRYGIQLVGFDTSVVSDVNIYHNTIVDCYGGFLFYGTYFSNVNIKNNIIARYSSTGVMTNNTPSGITWDYNHWHITPEANAQGAHDTSGDPLLTKTIGWRSISSFGGVTANDFKPTASSPCIGAALDIPFYSDYDYLNVARGTSPAIGALEYSSGASPNVVDAPSTFMDGVASDGDTDGWYDHIVGVAGSTGKPYRSVIKFDTSGLPKGVVSKVELVIYVTDTFNNSAEDYNYGPYGTTGRYDVETDAGITRWQRANVSSTYYVANATHIRTTGKKTIDLGANAVTHLQGVVDDGYPFFCVALMQLDEVSLNTFAQIAGPNTKTSGAIPPKLQVTFTGKAVSFGVKGYLSLGGSVPKGTSCGLKAYVVPFGWVSQTEEESPWTIQSPEDGASLIIP